MKNVPSSRSSSIGDIHFPKKKKRINDFHSVEIRSKHLEPNLLIGELQTRIKVKDQPLSFDPLHFACFGDFNVYIYLLC